MWNKLTKHTGIVLMQISIIGVSIVLYFCGMHHPQWLNLAPMLAIIHLLYVGFWNLILGAVSVLLYSKLEGNVSDKDKAKVNLDQTGLIFYFTEPKYTKFLLLFLSGSLVSCAFYNACFFSGTLSIITLLMTIINFQMGRESLNTVEKEYLRREEKSND